MGDAEDDALTRALYEAWRTPKQILDSLGPIPHQIAARAVYERLSHGVLDAIAKQIVIRREKLNYRRVLAEIWANAGSAFVSSGFCGIR